jgi:hypothetical protein
MSDAIENDSLGAPDNADLTQPAPDVSTRIKEQSFESRVTRVGVQFDQVNPFRNVQPVNRHRLLILDCNAINRVGSINLDTRNPGSRVDVTEAVEEIYLSNEKFSHNIQHSLLQLEYQFLQRGWFPSPDFVSSLEEHLSSNRFYIRRKFALIAPFAVIAKKLWDMKDRERAKKEFFRIFSQDVPRPLPLLRFISFVNWSKSKESQFLKQGLGSEYAELLKFMAIRKKHSDNQGITLSFLQNKSADLRLWNSFLSPIPFLDYMAFDPYVVSGDRLVTRVLFRFFPCVYCINAPAISSYDFRAFGEKMTHDLFSNYFTEIDRMPQSIGMPLRRKNRWYRLYKCVQELCTASESKLVEDIWLDFYLPFEGKFFARPKGWGWQIEAFQENYLPASVIASRSRNAGK